MPTWTRRRHSPRYTGPLVGEASFGRWRLRRCAPPLLAVLVCGCGGRASRDPAKSEATEAAGAAGAPALVDAASGGVSGVSVAAFVSCQRHVDCVVTHRGCCTSCGEESLANVVALNRDEVATYRDAACGSEAAVCSPCTSFSNPYLVARCVDGQCAASDLFQAPFSECEVSEDCHLRSNACCPCQQGAPLISVSVVQEPQLRAQLCDADTTCDDCSSVSVTDVDGGCRDGHCVLLFPF